MFLLYISRNLLRKDTWAELASDLSRFTQSISSNVITALTFLHDLRKKALLNCMTKRNRKGFDYIVCKFPVYRRSKHGLSKNTFIFLISPQLETFYPSYTPNCVVFDLKCFGHSYQVCSFFISRVAKIFIKVPNIKYLCLKCAQIVPKMCLSSI